MSPLSVSWYKTSPATEELALVVQGPLSLVLYRTRRLSVEAGMAEMIAVVGVVDEIPSETKSISLEHCDDE